MRKIIYCCLLISASLLAAFSGFRASTKPTSSEGMPVVEGNTQTWRTEPTDITESCRGVQFLDEQQGWLITDHALWWTSTGGKQWSRIRTAPPSGLFKRSDSPKIMGAVQFFDTKSGWLLEGDSLLQTRDGGVSWSETKLENILIRSFRFLNPAQGWFVGERMKLPGTGDSVVTWFPVIYKTEDGGEHWRRVFEGQPDNIPLWSIWPASARDVWAVGMGIFHSVDGGSNWGKVTIRDWGNIGGTPCDVRFLDEKTGWILSNGPGGYLFTNDAGKTWVPMPDVPSGFTDLIYINPSEAFAISGDVYYSNDQGLTWRPIVKGDYFGIQYLEKTSLIIAAGSSIAFSK